MWPGAEVLLPLFDGLGRLEAPGVVAEAVAEGVADALADLVGDAVDVAVAVGAPEVGACVAATGVCPGVGCV